MEIIRCVRLLAALGVLLITGSVHAETADPTPIADLTTDDLADGQQLFRVHCARCHGMLGDGGEGPSLKRATLRHAPSDDALFQVISEGIPGTGMPGTFGPNDAELRHIAGYVRSLGRLPPEAMPGDPEAGRILYETRGGCGACHINQGEGRGVGPELTDVGARRNLEYLRRSLTNPDADFPMLTSQMTGRTNAFLTVRLVSPEGEFEGMRVNEDEFSIQVRDLSGRVQSFDKRTLLRLDKAVGHSLMPGYDTVLTPPEVDDLASYLMSLKGVQP